MYINFFLNADRSIRISIPSEVGYMHKYLIYFIYLWPWTKIYGTGQELISAGHRILRATLPSGSKAFFLLKQIICFYHNVRVKYYADLLYIMHVFCLIRNNIEVYQQRIIYISKIKYNILDFIGYKIILTEFTVTY